MMNEERSLQRQLARFVDGELELDAENLLLAECEADPSRYRDLALAFVEQRRLRNALAGWELSSPLETAVLVNSVDTMPVIKPLGKQENLSIGPRRSTWLLGLAASLGIGIAAGYWGIASRDVNGVMRPVGGRAGAEDPGVLDGGSFASIQEQTNPSLHSVELPATNGEENRYLPNDSESLVRFVKNAQADLPFSEEAVRNLNADGVDVDQQARVFVIDMPDGRRLALPAGITNVSYRGE
jgi:hypothetical protein